MVAPVGVEVMVTVSAGATGACGGEGVGSPSPITAVTARTTTRAAPMMAPKALLEEGGGGGVCEERGASLISVHGSRTGSLLCAIGGVERKLMWLHPKARDEALPR